MRVVLVHGIQDTGRIFRTLAAHLEARGARCLTPTLAPADGSRGLEDLAHKLAAAIDAAFGPGDAEPFDLVGFSMGGLVSRYWLQELGGARRVRRFFAISVPFAGTRWAWLHRGRGVVQMRPGSEFLARLERGTPRLGAMPVVSYWTPYDLVIVPPRSSVWTRAENVAVSALCHPCMLHNRALRDDLGRRMGLPVQTQQ